MTRASSVGLLLIVIVVFVGGSHSSEVQRPCVLPPEAGMCRGLCPRFYYDANLRSCRPFNYGCCGGNANNFKTRDLCERVCGIRACPLIHCFVGACTVQTCPNFPKATCFPVCPCESVWIYNGEDVTKKCYEGKQK
uniref:U-actitoxin-Avd3l-like n=1 Tax=Crassostrea virginica TaxID=6565 RepID=A0A8B8ELL3_CRAVI|nr:U-actitoxin-Avd3l-like [Crassostrea virginica]